MTEQLAESFRIKTFFNADCGISMSEKMKIYVSDFADLQNRFKTILHGSWLGRFACASDDIEITIVPVTPENIQNEFGNHSSFFTLTL